jgi:hypothetical protein
MSNRHLFIYWNQFVTTISAAAAAAAAKPTLPNPLFLFSQPCQSAVGSVCEPKVRIYWYRQECS